MDVKPLVEVFEGDLLEVVCKVTTSLKKVEVFLKNTTNILKKSYGSFNHQFRIYESGEIVCKAEWNSVQKQVNQTVTLKGKYGILLIVCLKSFSLLTLKRSILQRLYSVLLIVFVT